MTATDPAPLAEGGWDRIFVVGAGPGAPDLITVRGLRLLERADLVVYAGSLVPTALLDAVPEGARVVDSAGMALREIVATLADGFNAGMRVVRLQTGDTSLFSAQMEQMRALAERGIPVEIVPGVSSANAAAAVLGVEFTLPEISQTVIYSRAAGRTPVPEGENLPSLAAHGATLVLFLSVQMIHRVVEQLAQGGYAPDTPVAVVHKATWPEQRIVRGTLENIVERVRDAGIKMTALIVVGRVLEGATLPEAEFHYSKLYDPGFGHGFRRRAGAAGV
ncbi:MAG: precorrin-4 C(11)-methyltransferase [Nitrospirae bacterium]|nr:precorrin-4 C(11)-methyltransferase [Nitrospirota bacterium]